MSTRSLFKAKEIEWDSLRVTKVPAFMQEFLCAPEVVKCVFPECDAEHEGEGCLNCRSCGHRAAVSCLDTFVPSSCFEEFVKGMEDKDWMCPVCCWVASHAKPEGDADAASPKVGKKATSSGDAPSRTTSKQTDAVSMETRLDSFLEPDDGVRYELLELHRRIAILEEEKKKEKEVATGSSLPSDFDPFRAVTWIPVLGNELGQALLRAKLAIAMDEASLGGRDKGLAYRHHRRSFERLDRLLEGTLQSPPNSSTFQAFHEVCVELTAFGLGGSAAIRVSYEELALPEDYKGFSGEKQRRLARQAVKKGEGEKPSDSTFPGRDQSASRYEPYSPDNRGKTSASPSSKYAGRKAGKGFR
eukprot:TRINITY_DN272_c0_g2_i1.p2 TRINITY_DN272_c0_g2~~TRINITY_DN272_c0_g2_i1.p2  ORF type:complete len:358 (+),score=70.98 TRINITY_DN272_c0_g2_i1:1593-2666(+)